MPVARQLRPDLERRPEPSRSVIGHSKIGHVAEARGSCLMVSTRCGPSQEGESCVPASVAASEERELRPGSVVKFRGTSQWSSLATHASLKPADEAAEA